jgi:DNA-binding NarL/FixJ family response regulator
LRQALKGGAAGYVLKKAADAELITAIQSVMRGGVYIHPSIARTLLDDMLPVSNDDALAPDDLWSTLSEREQEVLRMVALGHTGREIADKLSLSVKTVDTYRSRGMDKLGLRSRAALVRYAITHGLME